MEGRRKMKGTADNLLYASNQEATINASSIVATEREKKTAIGLWVASEFRHDDPDEDLFFSMREIESFGSGIRHTRFH